ncbi:hypothetical protein IJ182_01495 [bacterium]|nr:hypothetical protein [bacterium]
MNYCKRNLWILCCIIVFIIMLCFVTLFAQYNIYIFEDSYYTLLRKDDVLNQLFFNVYHGRYISNAITVFFGSIFPKFLNVHPFVFFTAWWGGSFIKTLFLFILFFQMNMFLFWKKKKNVIFPILILFYYILFQNMFAYTYEDVEYCSFLGFVFPFIFFCLFWYKFINLWDKEIITLKDIFIGTLYAFLVGISTEFTSIVTFFSLLIIIILRTDKLKYWASFFISLSFGMFLYFFNKGFSGVLNDHAPIFFNSATFKSELVFVKPFLKACFDVCIHEYGILILLIIVLSFTIFLQNKKENQTNNNLLFPFTLLIGGILFQIFLISDPALSPDNTYWVYHFDLVIQVKILLAIVCLYEMNCIKINDIYKNYLILSLIVVSMVVLSVKNHDFINNAIHNGFKYAIHKDSGDYRDRYLYEKINLYYIKNYNKIIFVPEKFAGYYSDIEQEYFEYFYNIKTKDNTEIITFDNWDDLYDKYINDGGIEITDDEIENADFQKLLIENKM